MTEMLPRTDINMFDYALPTEKIAMQPVAERDESRLLVYQNQQIRQDVFKNIANHLNENHLLVLNDTSVLPVRILFRKTTGTQIELFCLSPSEDDVPHQEALQVKGHALWRCYIGNNKRMNAPLEMKIVHHQTEIVLHAERVRQEGDAFEVRFDWQPESLTFGEVLDAVGKIPLPPYIKRPATAADKERYQTVFAKIEGSVAAPTAGLHFTRPLIEQMQSQNIAVEYITLHVGAGTFKPVTTDFAEEHPMHQEPLFFTKKTIENLLKQSHKSIVAVGTTTARALESLFWMGVKLSQYPQIAHSADLSISQWETYKDLQASTLKKEASLNNVLQYMTVNNLKELHTATSLMITPYYQPRMVKGLITNFHQPKSTLLLLISAFVGEDWKRIYAYALENKFRFLSYGDVSLFI